MGLTWAIENIFTSISIYKYFKFYWVYFENVIELIYSDNDLSKLLIIIHET